MATAETYLPTFEELEHPDIPFSTNILKAGAPQLGKYCEDKNDEFMLCRSELGLNRCVKEGKEVTDCTMEFFSKLKKNCYHELERFSYCLDKASADMTIRKCRKTQAAFDECVFEKFGIPKPSFGYFSRVRVYDSPRPAPPPEKPEIYGDRPFSPDSPDFPPPETGKWGKYPRHELD